MSIGLSLAHSNGSSPPTGHRRAFQSQPNPLQLTGVDSVGYVINWDCQTHCAYPECFHQLNPEKWPLFRKKIVVRRAPKPANPFQLTSTYSVAYTRNGLRQTHCSYLLLFQYLKPENRTLLSARWPFVVSVPSHELSHQLVRRSGRQFVRVLSHQGWGGRSAVTGAAKSRKCGRNEAGISNRFSDLSRRLRPLWLSTVNSLQNPLYLPTGRKVL